MQSRLNNCIWNGALRYDFVPEFQAKDLSGDPDFYMNLVIGLSYKYFGTVGVEKIFQEANGANGEQLSWLLLENVLFKRECPARPVLHELRKDYAKTYLSDDLDLKRRLYSLRFPLASRMTEQKCRAILGKRRLRLTKKEQRVFDLLKGEGIHDTEDVIARIKEISSLQFSLNDRDFHFKIPSVFHSLAKITSLAAEYSYRPKGTGQNAKEDTGKIFSPVGFLRRNRAAKEEEAIRKQYGELILSEKEHLAWEERFCTKEHKSFHLWLTRGRKKQDADISYLRTKEDFERHRFYYHGIIRRLSARLKGSLADRRMGAGYLSDSGKFHPPRAWRTCLPEERKFFLRKEETAVSDFSVDVLLDASASRMGEETTIAIQAYILAKGLWDAGIPVRVISYSTLFHTSVFTILKDLDEAPKEERILRYQALGWNRDGLIFSAYRHFLDEKDYGKKRLLILTDADPNDLYPMKRDFLAQTYGGVSALKDTKRSLDALRKKRIRINALLSYPTENAQVLFDERFAVISRMEQLATRGVSLLQKDF